MCKLISFWSQTQDCFQKQFFKVANLQRIGLSIKILQSKLTLLLKMLDASEKAGEKWLIV